MVFTNQVLLLWCSSVAVLGITDQRLTRKTLMCWH